MRHPVRFRHLAAAAAVVATFGVGATRARADLAPPDSCTAPGQPCMTAGPQFDQAGTCVAMTCTKQVPAPDGGMTTMTYDCHRCTAGGAGGANGSGGATGTGTGGSSQPTSKSSGCSVAAERGGGGSPPGAATLSMLAIAGMVVAAARRRNAGE
jgi:hypothetical protein